MKRIPILTLIVLMLGLDGCKTSSRLNCPDLASTKKMHGPVFALGHHIAHQGNKDNVVARTADTGVTRNSPLLASNSSDMPVKIKMLNSLTGQLKTDKDMEDMNQLLAAYSNNKVALQRNAKGKLFLRAHSIKDIFALAKNVNHSSAKYNRKEGGRDSGGAAIASIVLGPISFVFAFIPFLCLLAIPISLGAIIAGAIGIKSHRRRVAITGLIFGILGLILAALFTWIWWAFMVLLLIL